MKIQLTEEQILLIVKNETENLQKIYESDKLKLEKKHEVERVSLKDKLEADIAKLAGKFKFIDIDKPIKTKQKVTINTSELLQMVEEKKPVKEIAAHFKTSENSIRTKLWKMNIKISEI
jgi:DNA-binding NarL/FixJ family response regulator